MKGLSHDRLLGWIAWLHLASAHVMLTYPPPRKYQLDFLDNSTSSDPCHMPQGSQKTTLQSGKPFNVTWRLAYPHKGGYRIQLLDSLSRPVLDLTPVTSDSEFIHLDSTTNHLSVTVPPDFECENCTLRLVREAKEWKQTRWFSSCADINIKSKKTYRETCSGHGRYLLSKCRCDRLYYGEICQYKDECLEHFDCGEVGRCVDLDSDSPSQKQCYCEVNWFGQSCGKRSPLRGSNIDLSGHMVKELGPNFKLYWRLMEEEGDLEVVLVSKGTSYLAIGWKPESINATCLNLPDNSTVGEASEQRDELHPMECADMVIGSARGTSFRIWDYYSRDRSTPQLDSFWGGKNDLTAAMGYEKDGTTTIAFRKKMKSSHYTDHSILNQKMTVIWARGQDREGNDHWTDAEFENTPALHNFYKDDELKYHGFKDHRGVISLNFFEQTAPAESVGGQEGKQLNIINNCRGNWRTPNNCDPLLEECDYFAEWHYKARTDLIYFSITTKTNLWTGIAFSNDHKMAKTDAIIAIVDKNGRPFIMDTWIVGTISPYLDVNQDIQNTSMRRVNGISTFSFSRKRNTGDERDLAFTDDNCLYMMFPVVGGEFNPVNKNIKRHEVIPSISSRRVCIKACPASEEDLLAALEKRYLLEVKLANVGKDFQAPKVGTAEFDSLSESVGGAFQSHLSKYEKSLTVEVKEFKQSDQDVLTTLELHLTDPNAENSLRKSIESAVARGKVGTLLLDPSYQRYIEIKDKTSSDNESEFHRNSVLATILESWVVLGCLSALILLILIQACCTICNRSGGSKYNPKNMAWKDYSSGGMNYNIDQIDLEEKVPGTLRVGYQQKVPLSYIQNPKMHPGGSNNNLNDSKSLQRSKGSLQAQERNTHSLPRAPTQVEMQNGTYYTHRPHRPGKSDVDQVQPDFYFMPSQRKYSGEVVRVYVDYDNQNK